MAEHARRHKCDGLHDRESTDQPCLTVRYTPPAADPKIGRHGRNWTVKDPAGQLVCITVYRKGALEVVRRLAG
jgi:hypothetical protein